MWLFTTEGFYSIVTAEEFGHELQVRARAADDLDRLRGSYLPQLGPNVSMPGRDYPWRAYTTHEQLAECVSRLALAIDYSNFKNEVAHRQGYERAHVYGDVWSACRKIKASSKLAAPSTPAQAGDPSPGNLGVPPDRTDEYRGRDLHAEGAWPDAPAPNRRYGGVMFNNRGEVLLREPAGHYDGYYWTFSKGAAHANEHPVDAALRETDEETGHKPQIIGHIPEKFSGGFYGANYYYLMFATTEPPDDALAGNKETSSVRWATHDEARGLISRSTNADGRERDLDVLEKAYVEYAKL